ncbi:hypothetical protein WJX73_005555 [Symbiochloris irregularis]|uniref:Uncharacterized protein n=1 Tax=Symbiochloris irregularis TaxID=706552 RepID=A0AAW1P5A8_9CHLO
MPPDSDDPRGGSSSDAVPPSGDCEDDRPATPPAPRRTPDATTAAASAAREHFDLQQRPLEMLNNFRNISEGLRSVVQAGHDIDWLELGKWILPDGSVRSRHAVEQEVRQHKARADAAELRLERTEALRSDLQNTLAEVEAAKQQGQEQHQLQLAEDRQQNEFWLAAVKAKYDGEKADSLKLQEELKSFKAVNASLQGDVQKLKAMKAILEDQIEDLRAEKEALQGAVTASEARRILWRLKPRHMRPGSGDVAKRW